MSEPDLQNGDPSHHQVIDNASLAARIEICIARVDLAISEIKRVKEIAQCVADDQFELRTGLPPSWRRRLALVALAACVGALSGGLVQNASVHYHQTAPP